MHTPSSWPAFSEMSFKTHVSWWHPSAIPSPMCSAVNSKGRAESLAQDPQLFWVHLTARWGAFQNLFSHNHNKTLSQSSSCALRSSKRFARSVFWA